MARRLSPTALAAKTAATVESTPPEAAIIALSVNSVPLEELREYVALSRHIHKGHYTTKAEGVVWLTMKKNKIDA